METTTTAPELIAACEEGDRARISSLVSSIPIQAWTVIPGQAMDQLEPLRVLVWLETAGSGINSCEIVIVQLIVDEANAKQFSFRFSADELQLPRYNRLLIDLCRQRQAKRVYQHRGDAQRSSRRLPTEKANIRKRESRRQIGHCSHTSPSRVSNLEKYTRI